MSHSFSRSTAGILLLAGMILLAGCTAADNDKPAVPDKPNIILIFADDLSYRDLSIWGQEKFETPNLDALAAKGVRFTQSYAGAPECAPSRGTLMTGLHTGHAPIRINASARGQDHLADSDITIAEVLKDAGYATGMVGKWGIGLPGTPGTPDKQGFDYSYGYYDQARAHTFFPNYLMENGEKIPLPGNYGFDMERQYRQNSSANPDPKDVNRYDEKGDLIPHGIEEPSKAQYSEDLVEEKAVKFVRDHKDEPFFLYFATQLPHGPVIIDNLGELKDRDDFPSIKEKEWAAMVQRVDTFTGELVALLKELGIYENTIFFFASDNGYANCGYFGRGNANTNWPDCPFLHNKGPFRGGKFSALEGGIRVPFFATWEGQIKPGISNMPVWLVDLFPTFAQLAGGSYMHQVDGVSLVPLLMGDEDGVPYDRPLYWYKNDEQAVRMGPWKAYRKHPNEPVELYLIEEDTYCDRNVAEFYPEVVSEMERIMKASHIDHPWYHNPGETKEQFQAKRKKAEELGQLQVSVRGNTQK